jgi:hypothetical protein
LEVDLNQPVIPVLSTGKYRGMPLPPQAITVTFMLKLSIYMVFQPKFRRV